MNRYLLLFLAASGLVFAQESGGWRRVGDRPPAPPPPAASSDPLAQGQGQGPAQDPEPMDRSDAYGQPAPQQQEPVLQQRPQAGQPSMNRSSYGLPGEITLRPGTYITVRLGQALSSDHNQPGDTFVASLAQPVVVDGVVVANRNQMVYGRVAEAEKAHSDRPSRLALELTSLTLADGTQVPIRSQLVSRQGGSTPAGAQVGTVATTTGVGAVIGGIAGYGTGAAIGAGVGAVAGVAGVLLTRNHPTVVYPETALTFAIQSPVEVSTARAPQAFRYVGPDDYNHAQGEPQLQTRAAGPPPAYGAPYAPYPYYGGYYGYPYYYGGFYGPGIGVVIGRGYGYGYGRGYYGRYYYGHRR
jgi:hypothetical protein